MKCSKCLIEKNKTEFYRNVSRCKLCCHKYYENNKEKITDYYKRNKESVKKYKQEHYQKNKEKILHRVKKYREINQEYIKKYKKEYYQCNKEYFRKYINNRRCMSINYKLANSLRTRLNMAVKGNFKSGSAVRDLGCSIEDFKKHIESLWKPGMNWENYGIEGWHLDHIIPLASFDLIDREQFLKACHYTNIQPLWAIDNLRKSSKLI